MEIRDAFVELAMTSKALRLENKRLQVTKTEKEKTESELAHLYIAQCKKAEHIQERMMAKKQKPTIHVRNITSTECTEIMSETYERINVFRESTESFTSGMSVFGWRDCYRYENKDIDFSLTKTYRHHSMESVSGMVWNLFRHGATFAQLYPKSVTATFNEVQRLDDNNLLYFHTLEMGQQASSSCVRE
ncbi:hypothetical protein Poli38472_014258 [Pythium oligandrum]|uniref:Uncharacterized protein n=1 Tax=Pythium oligandrum TaxID=41045 RepID=A0A8K1FIS4_PYTOL|nr:hypothetical protein Poli38472_014258 [Pythium oligandrum]|eukprot:TMW64141.1 hypothetical protein Poli38472_014258 [Pythium oligandrum]